MPYDTPFQALWDLEGEEFENWISRANMTSVLSQIGNESSIIECLEKWGKSDRRKAATDAEPPYSFTSVSGELLSRSDGASGARSSRSDQLSCVQDRQTAMPWGRGRVR